MLTLKQASGGWKIVTIQWQSMPVSGETP